MTESETVIAAIAEAGFMTAMERNCDKVSSLCHLFCGSKYLLNLATGRQEDLSTCSPM
jgi:hypothetical protein